MPVASRSSSKALAFFVAFATFVALALPLVAGPLAEEANAQTPGPGVLDVTPETDQNQTGQTHTLTATITGSNQTGGVQVEVDFEIDCLTSCSDAAGNYVITSGTTGTTSAVDAPVDGDQTPQTPDDTRTSPEMSCTVTITNDPDNDPNDGTGSCTVSYQRFDAGDDLVAGWIDHTGGNATDESDATEQQCATANENGSGCAVPSGGAGGETEGDDTDVVSKNWFQAGATDVILDCDDESGNANNNAGTSDNQTNPLGQSETYTCKATRPDGPDVGSERDPANGIRIDAEQEGANDPDNTPLESDPNSAADRNDACTTDASGQCTFVLPAQDNEAGEAIVCFWYDFDNDPAYDDDGADADGGECDEEGVNEGEGNTTWGAGGGDDSTDLVRKFWGVSGVRFLNAEPEYDQNVQGTSHTVTATVTDDFGNPVAGVPVDFEIDGADDSRNEAAGGGDRLICDNTTTNAQGVATCTYTDEGTGSDPITPGGFETDFIDVCVDEPPTTGDDCNANEDTDDDPFATGNNGTTGGDRVQKFWFNQTPTATTLFIDMDPDGSDCGDGEPTGGGGTSYDETATNSTNSGHQFCVEVADQNGNDDPGEPVTVSLQGPGQFWFDADEDDEFDTGEGRGTSVTVGTDEEGEAFLRIFSTQSGTTTITATAENASDTATKTWTTQPPRTIDCDPETETNNPGDVHTVICTVLDVDNNPVPGVRVQAIEDGTGQFVNCPESGTDDHYGTQRAVCDTATDSSGEAVIQTISQTEGTQAIEVAIECDASNGGAVAGGICDNVTAQDRAGAPTDTDNACDMRAGEAKAGNEGDDGAQGVGSAPGAPAGVCFDQVAKTWDEQFQEPNECEDGIDNDNDGETDFPDDPECESPEDNDESGDVPPECTGQGIIAGTDGPDVLTGTEDDDVICGFGGNDTINGLGGNDVLLGGGGADDIDGGDGADAIEGDDVAACLETGCEAGNDDIQGGGSKDTIRGHGGNDNIDGGNKNDLIVGGQGDDDLFGNNGWDTIRGNAGDDNMVGQAGNDILQGGVGNDRGRGNAGNDTMRGFTGRDKLAGGAGSDIIRGGAGRDTLRGGSGRDTLDGGAGRDACFGGPGRDVLQRCE